jgi:prepilin-type N-terminal cleavage/methylation domain-containing protein
MKRGFTLIELLVVVVVGAVLMVATLAMINPVAQLAKANDSKRIADMTALSNAIDAYRLRNITFPGDQYIIRQSNVSVGGNPVDSVTAGWINEDFSNIFKSALPIDPKNTSTYNYRYTWIGEDYEIDTLLENTTNTTTKSANDGGNNATRYELGTDLTLLN